MKTLVLKNSEKLIYRRLKNGDQVKLKTFLKDISEYAHGYFTPHADDDETIDKVIYRSIADTDRVYIVLDRQGVIVAYFFLWWYSSEFPVLGVGIAEKYQGQGLGGKFIEVLIEDAKENHCKAIELTTVLNNKRAFTLYQKLGFLYLGKVNNLAGDGSMVEESHMYFPIEPRVKIPRRNHVTPF
ncbi:GNAT family N-acetyltransferase [Vibrio sp. 10N.261.55.A7]|uniref:GNAT family N-acetyltransferase n=1 Tax=Vibrio sp. 10N.261.55.A7 TaxID=1880851 RepID=UPI000C8524F7|nr:GNAT family N-acetyltransferase [Vibrio sp. 10N.261.55.A7]PMJ97761.1 hypothetical protein BCU12_22060 [Vibrio sp. 10N.261.55.A7]